MLPLSLKSYRPLARDEERECFLVAYDARHAAISAIGEQPSLLRLLGDPVPKMTCFAPLETKGETQGYNMVLFARARRAASDEERCSVLFPAYGPSGEGLAALALAGEARIRNDGRFTDRTLGDAIEAYFDAREDVLNGVSRYVFRTSALFATNHGLESSDVFQEALTIACDSFDAYDVRPGGRSGESPPRFLSYLDAFLLARLKGKLCQASAAELSFDELSEKRDGRLLALAHTPDPTGFMHSKAKAALVRELIGELPLSQQTAIRPYFGIDGEKCSLAEIGRELGITREGVRQRVLKGLSELETLAQRRGIVLKDWA